MIRRSAMGTWCDYCKERWGKNRGVWHQNAQRQAIVTIESVLPKSAGMVRNLCRDCVTDVQSWPDGSDFTIPQQVEYAKQVANV